MAIAVAMVATPYHVPSAKSTVPSFQAAFVPGLYVTFKCLEEKIAVNGTVYCDNQASVQSLFPTGFNTYTMSASPTTGFNFSEWTSIGDACFGVHPSCAETSATNPVDWWDSCGANSKCTATISVSSTPPLQTITAEIPTGAGTLKIGGTVLSDQQSVTLAPLTVESLAGTITNRSYHFCTWLSDDGAIGNNTSINTTFTVGTNSSGQGHLYMYLAVNCTVVFTAKVAGAAGTIDLSGTVLSGNSTITLTVGSSYSVSADVTGANYTFASWASDGASFSVATSATTTMTVTASQSPVAVISMITKFVPNTNWAGLLSLESGVSRVSGTFTIPRIAYSCNGACPFSEALPIWVGMGGQFGTAAFWQAGVDVSVTSQNSEGVFAWYEAYPAPSVYDNTALTIGSTITVTVTYNATSNESGFSFTCDSGSCGGGLPWSGNVTFAPNTSSAEWIVENLNWNPNGTGDPLPGFSTINFTAPQVAATGLESSTYCLTAMTVWTAGSNATASVSALSPAKLTISRS